VGLHKPHRARNVPQKRYDIFPLSDIKLRPYQKLASGDQRPNRRLGEHLLHFIDEVRGGNGGL
jgi:hypothetical protein